MSIVDSISSNPMDTPIATIFMFDWTTNVMESVTELIIVLRDMEEDFVVVISNIIIMIGSNLIKNELIAMQHTVH